MIKISASGFLPLTTRGPVLFCQILALGSEPKNVCVPGFKSFNMNTYKLWYLLKPNTVFKCLKRSMFGEIQSNIGVTLDLCLKWG